MSLLGKFRVAALLSAGILYVLSVRLSHKGASPNQSGTRVFINTGLRIQALHMVNSSDFTFSNGYLGLLSELGALLGIICCCVPCVAPIYHWRRRKLSPQTESQAVMEDTFRVISRRQDIQDPPFQLHKCGSSCQHPCGTASEQYERSFWAIHTMIQMLRAESVILGYILPC